MSGLVGGWVRLGVFVKRGGLCGGGPSHDARVGARLSCGAVELGPGSI